MIQPTSMEEYEDLVEQALMEVDELRYSAEFDEGEEWGGVNAFLDGLEKSLQRLRLSMLNGSYTFGDADLPYMELIRGVDPYLLPFKHLLETINQVHRNGLADGEA